MLTIRILRDCLQIQQNALTTLALKTYTVTIATSTNADAVNQVLHHILLHFCFLAVGFFIML